MNSNELAALDRVLCHYWHDEEKHWEDHRSSSHIFHDLKALKNAHDRQKNNGGPQTATVEIRDMENNEVATEEHFGGCPECGKNDGYLNCHRTHVFFCDEHKTAWVAGSNIFSSWRAETEEDWKRNEEKLKAYRRVKPVHPKADGSAAPIPNHDQRAECRAEEEAYRLEQERFHGEVFSHLLTVAELPPEVRDLVAKSRTTYHDSVAARATLGALRAIGVRRDLDDELPF